MIYSNFFIHVYYIMVAKNASERINKINNQLKKKGEVIERLSKEIEKKSDKFDKLVQDSQKLEKRKELLLAPKVPRVKAVKAAKAAKVPRVKATRVRMPKDTIKSRQFKTGQLKEIDGYLYKKVKVPSKINSKLEKIYESDYKF